MLSADSIPAELRDRRQWVCWRHTPKVGKTGEWTKEPVNPHTGELASSTNPATWGAVAEAMARTERDGLAGIGYVFSDADPYTGGDLDTCRDVVTGQLEPWAAEIVRQLDSYTEVSPSGTGVHIIIRATKPAGRNRRGPLELYDRGRYFTMTGDRLAGTPATINDRQDEIEALHQRVFGAEQSQPSNGAGGNSLLSDTEILEKLREAKNGPKFAQLWAGDVAGCDSASEADLALCSLFAFYTSDREQIDRLFRRSGLMRDKWDRADYRDRTIAKALQRDETWEPPGTVPLRGRPSTASTADAASEPADRVLRFQSAREIAESTTAEPSFRVYGYVVDGALCELDGKIKAAGKTTLILAMCRAVLDGGDFLGQPTKPSPVVYLSEQPPASFREALRRADLLERDDFRVLFWHDTIGVEWPEVVLAARAEAQRIGARLLVADTLGQFAGIRGDAENNAGTAMEAVAPLQAAAADGLAVVILRHERKGGGEVGDSARGSSALAGAVDIVLQLRRPEGAQRPGIRVLNALSRFDQTPETQIIELTDAGYVALGDAEAVAQEEARAAVLAAAPANEADAMREPELLEAAGVKRTVGQAVIREYVEAGQLARIGAGKKGNPFLYWRPNPADIHSAGTPVAPAERISQTALIPTPPLDIHSAALKNGVPAERILPDDSGTTNVPATTRVPAVASPEMRSAGTTPLGAAERNGAGRACVECGEPAVPGELYCKAHGGAWEELVI